MMGQCGGRKVSDQRVGYDEGERRVGRDGQDGQRVVATLPRIARCPVCHEIIHVPSSDSPASAVIGAGDKYSNLGRGHDADVRVSRLRSESV